MSNKDELVTVATYRFAPKAEMARALLEQEGFEAFVADATLVTTGWLLGSAVGHIKLQVPTQQAALANSLLQRHPQLLDHGPLGDEAAFNETKLNCPIFDKNVRSWKVGADCETREESTGYPP